MPSAPVPHRRPPRSGDLVGSRRILVGSLLATVLTALVFTVWPNLDLVVAGRFWSPADGFVGKTATGRVLRLTFECVPFLILAGMGTLYAMRRLGGARVWAPNGAGLLMMVASMALGPGLLVNTILKENAHRPRPIQVTQFGGADDFRPFYRTDGACEQNCSFVSGEGSSAFWTVAPALLAPPLYRTLAIAAAIGFGVLVSLLRIAFGGHFLSDSIFAGLFVWLVIVGCWRLVSRLAGHPPGSDRG